MRGFAMRTCDGRHQCDKGTARLRTCRGVDVCVGNEIVRWLAQRHVAFRKVEGKYAKEGRPAAPWRWR
jgi:hypothetical protein